MLHALMRTTSLLDLCLRVVFISVISVSLSLSLSLFPINHHLPLQSGMVLRRRVDGMYRRLFPDKFSLVSSLSWPKCAGKSVILLEKKPLSNIIEVPVYELVRYLLRTYIHLCYEILVYLKSCICTKTSACLIISKIFERVFPVDCHNLQTLFE